METRGRASSRRTVASHAAPASQQGGLLGDRATRAAAVTRASGTAGELSNASASGVGSTSVSHRESPDPAPGNRSTSPPGPLTRSRAATKRALPSGETPAADNHRPHRSKRLRVRRFSGTARSSGSSAPAMSDSPDPPAQPPTNPDGSRPGTSAVELEASEATLHGLLRRLSAGLDDMFPASGSSQGRLRAILTTLRGPAEETARLDALSQLCHYLSVGTEESMASFSIDSFVPPLVALLSEGNSPDVMIMAARALNHMMDALPASASSIAHNNGAPALCANLLAIEYIDLAEQSLQALEKLSVDYPQPIVRAGGFAAALSYIDFFSIGVQRVAAITACNLCRSPPSDSMDAIVSVLPKMMELLASEDQRIREMAMIGFSRLADAFRTSSEKLETLCGGEDGPLISNVIVHVLSTSPPSLSPQAYASSLKLLATLSRGNARLGNQIIGMTALVDKMRGMLSSEPPVHASDCLALCDAMLPEAASPEPESAVMGAISAATASSRWSRRRRVSSSTQTALAAVDAERRERLHENPAPLTVFLKALLPCFMTFYTSSADSGAKRVVLSILPKMLALSPESALKDLVLESEPEQDDEARHDAPRFASFVAGLLSENCSPQESLAGLSLVHFALTKLPDLRGLFVREGVVHEVSRIASQHVASEQDGEARDGDGDEQMTSTASTAVENRSLPVPIRTPGSAAASSSLSRSPPPPDRATDAADAPRRPARVNPALAILEEEALLVSRTSANTSAVAGRELGLMRAPIRLSSLSRGAPPPEVSPEALGRVAQGILESDMGSFADSGSSTNSTLGRLTDLRAKLEAIGSSEDVEQSRAAITVLVEALGSRDGVSTFEVSHSGIVPALYAHFASADTDAKVRTSRTAVLVELLNTQAARNAFKLLVSRILGVFAAEEELSIRVSESISMYSSSSAPASSFSSGLRQLTQPFKLCLKRDTSDSSVPDLPGPPHHVIYIEPLATMASIEEFVLSRFQADDQRSSEDGDPESAGGTQSAADDSAGAEANDASNGDAQDDDEEEAEDGAGSDRDESENEGENSYDDDEHMEGGDDDDDVVHSDEMSADSDHHDEEHEEAIMFSLDEDTAANRDDDANPEGSGQGSDEGFSSGSGDAAAEDDEDGDDDDAEVARVDPFGAEQLSTSLPAVELDHDAFARSPTEPEHPSQPSGGPSGSSASNRPDAPSPSGLPRPGQSGSAMGLGSMLERAGSSVGARPAAASSAGARAHANLSSARSRSYAAALAMGLREAGASSIGSRRGERGPWGAQGSSGEQHASLYFSLRGRRIPRQSSILQAVIQSHGDSATLNSRLWGDIYTLEYKSATAGGEGPRGSASGSPGGGRDATDTGSNGASVYAASSGSPTAEASSEAARAEPPGFQSADAGSGVGSSGNELSTSAVLDRDVLQVPGFSLPDSIPEKTRTIVGLLKYLHWVAESLSESSGDAAMRPLPLLAESQAVSLTALAETPPKSFVSQKLVAKLTRQLSDPLAICGGVVPKWCHALAEHATFLLPVEARMALFQSTELGTGRALQLLQSRTNNASAGLEPPRHASHHRSQSARDAEARVTRINRHKVRIHRSRVLESALRVMAMHGSENTMLEVEYFDEAGTGLGPTLEFYTLVSRELQRTDLDLWRSKGASKLGTDGETGNPGTQGVREASGVAADLPPGADAGTSLGTTHGEQENLTERSGDNCTQRATSHARRDVSYIVPTGRGLMPKCLGPSNASRGCDKERLTYFTFMGKFIGKALMDGRLLDLRLSPVFCRLLLACIRSVEDLSERRAETHEENDGDWSSKHEFSLKDVSTAAIWGRVSRGAPGLDVLAEVDPQLALSLKRILDMELAQQADVIEGLCLSFTLPGEDDIELCENGASRAVTLENARDYVAAVIRYVLCTGLLPVAEAVLRGYAKVLNVKSLCLFHAEELEMLMCGPAFEKWTSEFLIRATRCDHGYRHDSAAVVSFLRVLSELDANDQRRFVLFATGSPALPVGGLMGLQPRFTIVKRAPEAGRIPDECLPTVMTCSNYFKLPEYSSYDIMRERILYALREGQGSFHLS